MTRRGEPGDIADLGHEDGGEDGPDTRDRLDGVVAEVTGEPRCGLLLAGGDLGVDQLDELTQALDAEPVGRGEGHGVQQVLAGEPEQVAHRHADALLGQDGVDLGLQSRTEVDELGPGPDELTHLAQLRWGDPRLGQAPHAQQVDEVGRVAFVVLQTPVAPVVPQRMGQVHGRAALFEHVGCPVVSVGPERGATFRMVRLSGPHSRTGRASSPASGSPRAHANRLCGPVVWP